MYISCLGRGETNMLDYDVGVYEFSLQSFYYCHFRTNTYKKGMNSFISLVMA